MLDSIFAAHSRKRETLVIEERGKRCWHWVGDRIQEKGLALAMSTLSSPIVDHWREKRAGDPDQGSRLSWGWENREFTSCWPLFSQCNRK